MTLRQSRRCIPSLPCAPHPAPQLIAFGLSLFISANNQARTTLLKLGLPGLVTMLVGLAPTVGSYYKDDETLKQRKDRVDAEARQAKAPAAAAPSRAAEKVLAN